MKTGKAQQKVAHAYHHLFLVKKIIHKTKNLFSKRRQLTCNDEKRRYEKMFNIFKKKITDPAKNLMDMISGDDTANILSLDGMAEILNMKPEMLKEFESRYRKEAISIALNDGSYYDVSLSQVKNTKITERELPKVLDDIIERIVEGLLLQTVAHSVKNGILSQTRFEAPKGFRSVTAQELKALPKEMRPQLTESLICRDMPESSSVLLFMYKKYLEEKNPGLKKQYYGMFRSGLDFLDLDEILYRILGQNPNTIGNWLPAVAEANKDTGFFKIPDTVWLKVPITLLQLTRLEYSQLNPVTLQILDRYCKRAFSLDENGDYFIKTGTCSSKFDFRNARVTTPKEVNELGEYLCFVHNQAVQMAGPLNKPCGIYGMGTTNEWAVRQFIPDSEGRPAIYKGLPLRCEYRVFVDFDEKAVLGMTPYWRKDVMTRRFSQGTDKDSVHMRHDYVAYRASEKWLESRYQKNKGKIRDEVLKLVQNTCLTGQWSIDIMQDGQDFYLIDMAVADQSALNDCVPKGLLKSYPEKWIPRLE